MEFVEDCSEGFGISYLIDSWAVGQVCMCLALYESVYRIQLESGASSPFMQTVYDLMMHS